jgi:hypothetical protein
LHSKIVHNGAPLSRIHGDPSISPSKQEWDYHCGKSTQGVLGESQQLKGRDLHEGAEGTNHRHHIKGKDNQSESNKIDSILFVFKIKRKYHER